MGRERELPRREISTKSEKTFEEKRKDIEKKTPHRIGENPRNHKAKARRELAADLLLQINGSLDNASQRLRSLATVRRGSIDTTEAAKWRETVSAYRGDLSGFWNDIKVEVAGRGGSSTAENNLISTAADLLEAAERKGGLSGWLDRWKDAIAAPGNELSWEELGDLADRVRAGIEFCTALVDEAFGSQTAGRSRTNLHLALDAIAAEVAREIEAFRKMDRIGVAGTELEAVKDRLKVQDRRAGVEERLHQAWTARPKGLGAKCVAEVPGIMREAQKVQSAAHLIEGWRSQAADVEKYINTTDVDPDDLRNAAKTLDAASRALCTKIRDMYTVDPSMSGTDNLGPTRHSNLCFVLRQIASELVELQVNLGNRTLDQEAKDALLHGAGLKQIRSAGGFIENYDQTQNKASIYTSVRDARELARTAPTNPAAGFGRLTWSNPCKYTMTKLGEKSFPGYDPALATRFQNEIIGVGDLDKSLDRWGARQPGETYGLAWELVAGLRDHKRKIEAMFPVSNPLREFLGYNLDAITGVVAGDLKRESPATQ
jgi:hypothetical protein